jgi:hypothetical protein
MAMEAAISSTTSARPGLPGVIVAATIGNVLEWFDFVVYGFFAVTIAEVFFPVGNPTVSLLITFGTFGLAFLVRPLGAIIVGTYTDRAGRKAGLTARLRVQARERWPRYSRAATLSWPQEHSTHRAIHRNGRESVQGFLALAVAACDAERARCLIFSGWKRPPGRG